MRQNRNPPHAAREFFIHLVSDATGSTLQGLAKACLVQFEGIEPHEKFWNLIRTKEQVEMVLQGIEDEPGPVLMTLVNPALRTQMREGCRKMKLPCIPVLDPVMKGLSSYLGQKGLNMPGLQHQMDDEYFARIDAIDYAMHHDDGQNMDGLDSADIILVGVSRTSKTPTCIYLANRGVRAGNIPLVPDVKIPEEFLTLANPLYIGLTESPVRLVERRKTRLLSDSDEKHYKDNLYLSEDAVAGEVRAARKLFSAHGWPVIDVTKRSVEETAAEILMLFHRYRDERTGRLLT